MRYASRSLRYGQSMIELVAATAVVAIALVPALRLTRNSLHQMEQLERRELCLALCGSRMESVLASTSHSWEMRSDTGRLTDEGYSELCFDVSKSDVVIDGGLPDRLALIDVRIWHDSNSNGRLDQGEASARLTTKLAKDIPNEVQILHP